MSIKVAISAEAVGFSRNRILDYEVAKNYPGALWSYFLKQFLLDEYEVVTADIALENLGIGLWDCCDVLVIQHVHDHIADSLVKMGCRPLLILCFESPLYVGHFYDHCDKIASNFEYQYLPTGLIQANSKTKLMHPRMCFPSYDDAQIFPSLKAWSDRNAVVIVASNKFTLPRFPKNWRSLSYLLWWAKYRLIDFFFGARYDSLRFPMEDCELQSYRLEILLHFLKVKKLDIYGRGWDRLKYLPPLLRRQLKELLNSKEVSICQDKITQISGYKFCLCIENASFPGYVTEKIIDCFVAGVVPLYMGAPDIQLLVPKESFVDLRKFNNLNEVDLFLNELSPKEAENMINMGRDFLRKKENSLFSYQGFARGVELIIRQTN